jgi:phenylpropionate dioxygenase-like ring-hydroxylating dioxygenase large terminal subunit
MFSAPSAAAWWPLALSEDVVSGQPFAAHCGELQIALFRDQSGAVRALEDRCAHRRAPLSLGRITTDGWIQCPYHGWTYDGSSGACRLIPNLGADERVPAYGVRPFAVREQSGWIYVWTGAQADAAQTVPPRMETLTDSGQQQVALPHGLWVESLLDGPGAVLDFGSVVIVHDQRRGDPACRDGQIVTEFGADWTAQQRRRKRAAVDLPLTLRLTVQPLTGLAQLELRDDAEQLLLRATVASAPVNRLVTAVRWRCGPVATSGLTIAARAAISAAQLLPLGIEGAQLWRKTAASAAVA